MANLVAYRKTAPQAGQSIAKNVTKNSTLGAKQVIKDGKLTLMLYQEPVSSWIAEV
jgi:hypothetical protein